MSAFLSAIEAIAGAAKIDAVIGEDLIQEVGKVTEGVELSIVKEENTINIVTETGEHISLSVPQLVNEFIHAPTNGAFYAKLGISVEKAEQIKSALSEITYSPRITNSAKFLDEIAKLKNILPARDIHLNEAEFKNIIGADSKLIEKINELEQELVAANKSGTTVVKLRGLTFTGIIGVAGVASAYALLRRAAKQHSGCYVFFESGEKLPVFDKESNKPLFPYSVSGMIQVPNFNDCSLCNQKNFVTPGNEKVTFVCVNVDAIDILQDLIKSSASYIDDKVVTPTIHAFQFAEYLIPAVVGSILILGSLTYFSNNNVYRRR